MRKYLIVFVIILVQSQNIFGNIFITNEAIEPDTIDYKILIKSPVDSAKGDHLFVSSKGNAVYTNTGAWCCDTMAFMFEGRILKKTDHSDTLLSIEKVKVKVTVNELNESYFFESGANGEYYAEAPLCNCTYTLEFYKSKKFKLVLVNISPFCDELRFINLHIKYSESNGN